MALYDNSRYAIVVAVAIVFVMSIFILEASFMYHELSPRERFVNYNTSRAALVTHERYVTLGGKVVLSHREKQVSEVIMSEKLREYEDENGLFKPAQPFSEVYQSIADTPLFHRLRAMPKGAVLNADDMSLCSTDYLLQLTYRDALWVCRDNGGTYRALRFSVKRPKLIENCEWTLLDKLRGVDGANVVDDQLRQRFTLFPLDRFKDTDSVLKALDEVHHFVSGMLTYMPVFSDYLEHALAEFYADGVRYVEIRSSMPLLYDLEHSYYTMSDTAFIMQEMSVMLKTMHNTFMGLKVIYAPSRNVNESAIDTYLDTAFQLKYNFPHLFAGFDLSGREDTGRPLRDFAAKLLSAHGQIDFYFNAGEANTYGTRADENLLDAVLLGTKRIGHAYALLKHPEIMRLVRQNGIAIEVSPIANQIMRHIGDLRNHPCVYFFASGYPVVIGSGSASFWKATPLTHDYYMAFVGFASRSADLGMLKQLAWNSIFYSALDSEAKELALASFLNEWSRWIDEVFYENKLILPTPLALDDI